MRRIVNLRCFLVVALYTVLTVFFALLSILNTVLGSILFGLLLISAIVFYILSRCFTEKKVFRLTFLLSFLFSLFTFIGFRAAVADWAPDVQTGESYSVEGVVQFNDLTEGQTKGFVLTKLKINGKKVPGKLRLNFGDSDSKLSLASAGFRVSFRSKIFVVPLIADSGAVNGTSYRTNIRYSAYIRSGDAAVSPGRAPWNERFLSRVSETLNLNMGDDYGGIVYSMLTGNRDNIDEEISDYFSAAGLGHIMAVSGLHIGFIALLLRFVFRKLHVPKKAAIPVVSAILLFYAYLVGFSPSVMRAVVMAIIGLVAMGFGTQKDALNSLCAAVAFILVVSPLYLFEVGFVLSVCAVFAMILFSPPIGRALEKIRIPHRFASACATVFSVQIGVVPATVYFFRQFQLYAVFANLLLMPLILLSFLAILIALPLTMLLSVFSFLLKFAGLGIAAVAAVTEFVALLPMGNVTVPATVAVFVCYVLYFVASRFVMLPRLKKTVSCLAMGVSFLVLLFPACFAGRLEKAQPYTVLPVQGSRDVTSVLDDGRSVNVIGDLKSAYGVREALVSLGIRKIDAVYLFELDRTAAEQVIKLNKLFSIGRIFCPKEGIGSGIGMLTDAGIDNFYAYSSENAPDAIRPVYVNEKAVAYLFGDERTQLLFMRYSSNYSVLPAELINRVSAIRSFLYSGGFRDRVYITNMPSGFLDADLPVLQLSVADSPKIMFQYYTGEVLQYM